MKLHSDPRPFYNTFTAYGAGFVEVNERRHSASCIVLPEGEVTPWGPKRFAELRAADFEQIAALAPEIVLFGTGLRLQFAHPSLTRALSQAGIGLETMDLFAACRTYNILMSEGRQVAAALLIEAPDAGS